MGFLKYLILTCEAYFVTDHLLALKVSAIRVGHLSLRGASDRTGIYGSGRELYSAWAGLRRFPASWLDYNIRIVVMIRLVFGGVPGWLGIACN